MKNSIMAACGVIIASVAGFVYLQKNEVEGASVHHTASAGFEVPVMTVSLSDIDLAKEYSGRVNAYKVSEVRPQVSGVIQKRMFEEGAEVVEGQQLYQIDEASYLAALNSAKAALQKANATYQAVKLKAKRYTELAEENAVSKQEYDDVVASQGEAAADIAIAKASVATAQVSYDYTKVYAPISGRVGLSTVTEGALVTANQTDELTTITQLDPVYVDMTGSESDLMGEDGRQKFQGAVTLFLGDGKVAYPHQGEVRFSDVTVNETTGTLKLRAVFPNPDHILLPGQFVRARINGAKRQAILIPQSAALRGADTKLSVFVLEEGNVVKSRPISATEAIGNQWIVSDGLSAGDVIVLSGFQKIKEGDVVSIAKSSLPVSAVERK